MAKQPPKKSQGKAAPKQLDAVQMLKADHKQVKKLFEQFHTSSEDEQGSIAGRLFTELEIHTILEEELFYPAVRSKLHPADTFEATAKDGVEVSDEDEEMVELDDDEINGMDLEAEEDEDAAAEELITAAYEEHQAAKDLIGQLKTLKPGEGDYEELFNELEEAVIEHIVAEEDVILPLAMSELDIQALGLTMQRRRDDLLSSLAA
jgi:hemerythrin superfamily protein